MRSIPDCYSIRLLNPLRGTVQIVELDATRAISTDGVNWRIQLRSEIYQHPWQNLQVRQDPEGFLLYGVWNTAGELARLPIHPSLYREHVEQSVAELLTVLPAVARQVPFVARDKHELWLLHPTRPEPIVLLASACDAHVLPKISELNWYPVSHAEHSFTSSTDTASPLANTPSIPAHSRLAQHVLARAGTPPQAHWFERQVDGSGIGVNCHHARNPFRGMSLHASRFPELLLQEHWPDGEQQLIDDYFTWQAPSLLTLPGLSVDRRRVLEKAAALQPLRVQQLHRLYPQIIDVALLNSILVEAVLRQANPDRQT